MSPKNQIKSNNNNNQKRICRFGEECILYDCVLHEKGSRTIEKKICNHKSCKYGEKCLKVHSPLDWKCNYNYLDKGDGLCYSDCISKDCTYAHHKNYPEVECKKLPENCNVVAHWVHEPNVLEKKIKQVSEKKNKEEVLSKPLDVNNSVSFPVLNQVVIQTKSQKKNNKRNAKKKTVILPNNISELTELSDLEIKEQKDLEIELKEEIKEQKEVNAKGIWEKNDLIKKIKQDDNIIQEDIIQEHQTNDEISYKVFVGKVCTFLAIMTNGKYGVQLKKEVANSIKEDCKFSWKIKFVSGCNEIYISLGENIEFNKKENITVIYKNDKNEDDFEEDFQVEIPEKDDIFSRMFAISQVLEREKKFFSDYTAEYNVRENQITAYPLN